MDCPECGGALAAYVLEGREAAVCERCGWVGIEAEHRGEPRPAESWGDALDRFYDRHAETERRTAELPTVAATGGDDASDEPSNDGGERGANAADDRETEPGDADETGHEADEDGDGDDGREAGETEREADGDEDGEDGHETGADGDGDDGRETDADETDVDADGADLDDVAVTALVEDAVAEADDGAVTGLIEEAEPDGRTDEDDADGTTD